jgi:hypothetical protein
LTILKKKIFSRTSRPILPTYLDEEKNYKLHFLSTQTFRFRFGYLILWNHHCSWGTNVRGFRKSSLPMNVRTHKHAFISSLSLINISFVSFVSYPRNYVHTNQKRNKIGYPWTLIPYCQESINQSYFILHDNYMCCDTTGVGLLSKHI